MYKDQKNLTRNVDKKEILLFSKITEHPLKDLEKLSNFTVNVAKKYWQFVLEGGTVSLA